MGGAPDVRQWRLPHAGEGRIRAVQVHIQGAESQASRATIPCTKCFATASVLLEALISDNEPDVATGRQRRNTSCKQRADLLQLRPPNRVYLLLTSRLLAVDQRSGLAQPPIRGLIVMKSAIIKVAAVAAFTMLAGCQDLKPLQADIDNLKQQVSRLNADLAAAKSSADAANAAAQSASSTASGAQSAANQALAAAQASQSCCDATNEKIDRMFRRSISK